MSKRFIMQKDHNKCRKRNKTLYIIITYNWPSINLG